MSRLEAGGPLTNPAACQRVANMEVCVPSIAHFARGGKQSVNTRLIGFDSTPPHTQSSLTGGPLILASGNVAGGPSTFIANMFLMWQSSTANSIPVPLGYQNWGFSGTATCSTSCETASNWTVTTNGTPGPIGGFVTSSPSQTQTNDGNNILVDGYPTWTTVSP